MKRRTILKGLGTGIAITSAAGAAQAAVTSSPDGGLSPRDMQCEVECPEENCPDKCEECLCI